MAVNEQWMDAPPERVFAMLTDPDAYPEWVVGGSRGARRRRGLPGGRDELLPARRGRPGSDKRLREEGCHG
jgi:uncharacterized protein YndB with AHSA1/START domain